MTLRFANPFRPVKFEDEGSPLIYVSDQAILQFTAGNYFFTGKRGCGKTSILKVSDTIFQHQNVYLREYPNREIFLMTFGVYINLNNRELPNFFEMREKKTNRHLLQASDSRRALTTYYIEMIILQKIIENCIVLRDLGVFKFDYNCEADIVKSIKDEYDIEADNNIDHLLIQIQNCLVHMIEFSRYSRDDIPSFRTRYENKFHEVAGQILRAVRLNNSHLKQLRILIDDCETLPPEYHASLNTLIRTPRGQPIAWSIAYVDGRYRAAETTIVGQTLAREERAIVSLDGLDGAEFEKFCNEVCRLRVQRAVPDEGEFNIKEKLSSFEIDELCMHSFSETKNKRALAFLSSFEARENKNLKIWEFFLERADVKNIVPGDGLRKKALSSYICICAKYNIPMYYAGFKTVVGLSDGCIRDFLEIVGSLYEQVTRMYMEPERFFRSEVYDIREQDRGCREAASRKLSSISDFAEKEGYYLSKLIPCLGHLVKMFQHDYKYRTSLKNPDRSVFAIGVGRSERYVDIIKDAEVDGYVRRVDARSRHGVYCFRLHRQFAPNFDISYREPSEHVIPIPIHFLYQINEREQDNPAAWAEKVFEAWLRKRQNVAQGDLLDSEEDFE